MSELPTPERLTVEPAASERPVSEYPVSARRTAAVIGGGPAGLIAAEMLATDGFAVTIFEHSRSVGRKFLLAGRGGLNITHSEPPDEFVRRYDAAGWMMPLLAEFGPDDLRAWCSSLGEPTFVGSSGRVFPASFRATPLLRAWLRRLDALGCRGRDTSPVGRVDRYRCAPVRRVG